MHKWYVCLICRSVFYSGRTRPPGKTPKWTDSKIPRGRCSFCIDEYVILWDGREHLVHKNVKIGTTMRPRPYAHPRSNPVVIANATMLAQVNEQIDIAKGGV